MPFLTKITQKENATVATGRLRWAFAPELELTSAVATVGHWLGRRDRLPMQAQGFKPDHRSLASGKAESSIRLSPVSDCVTA